MLHDSHSNWLGEYNNFNQSFHYFYFEIRDGFGESSKWRSRSWIVAMMPVIAMAEV